MNSTADQLPIPVLELSLSQSGSSSVPASVFYSSCLLYHATVLSARRLGPCVIYSDATES